MPSNARIAIITLLSSMCLLISMLPVTGQTTLHSTGFERPAFTTGALNGQNGFLAFGGFSVDAASITDVNPNSGSQHVKLDGTLMEAIDPDLYAGYYYTPINFDPNSAGQPIVSAQADVLFHPEQEIIGFRFGAANHTPSYAGFEAYDTLGSFAGGIVIGDDGLVHGYSDFDFANEVTTAASFDQYHTLGIRLNYLTHMQEFMLDGSVFGALGFSTMGDLAVDFGDADLTLYGFAPFESYAYFDNYHISAAAEAPEPGAFAMLAGALGVGMCRSRKKI